MLIRVVYKHFSYKNISLRLLNGMSVELWVEEEVTCNIRHILYTIYLMGLCIFNGRNAIYLSI